MQAATPFISYSINREDVLLNRLFGGRDSGFFVDVGAAHPVLESDTKALSDRGWTGINIEPNVSFYRELVAQRPRDRNLNVAVSDQPGAVTFYEVMGTGLSTCDPDAARHAGERGFQVVTHEVEARSLREVLEEASPPQIDLLKIDVEGFELKVLASNDWGRFRPRLIMAEATFPETPVRRPDHITSFLDGQGYRHVYFDGLNDYYAEQGFDVPGGVFDRPLNVFDHFVPYTEVLLTRARDSLARDVEALTTERDRCLTLVASLNAAIAELNESLCEADRHASLVTERAQSLEIDLDRANREITGLRRHVSELVGAGAQAEPVPSTHQALQLAREIAALRASTSWRITRPLRALARPRRTLKLLLGHKSE